MSLTPEEIEFATDLFSGLGDITTRRMMGGLCLYHQGTIFAMVHSEHGIMIKGSGAFKDELEAMGLWQWTYSRKQTGKTSSMPYWKLPESAQDDPEEACALARRALTYL